MTRKDRWWLAAILGLFALQIAIFCRVAEDTSIFVRYVLSTAPTIAATICRMTYRWRKPQGVALRSPMNWRTRYSPGLLLIGIGIWLAWFDVAQTRSHRGEWIFAIFMISFGEASLLGWLFVDVKKWWVRSRV